MSPLVRHLLCAAVLATASAATAHESPIDHVDREYRLAVKADALVVSYRIGLTERAALMQLHAIDTNADGRIDDAEADTFFKAQATTLAGLLKLQLDGQPLVFTPTAPVQRDARFGQTYTFSAPLGKLTPGRHLGVLADGHSRMYPGAFRWLRPGEGGPKDIRVEAVVVPQDAGVTQREHPPWIELKFAIVVPQ